MITDSNDRFSVIEALLQRLVTDVEQIKERLDTSDKRFNEAFEASNKRFEEFEKKLEKWDGRLWAL